MTNITTRPTHPCLPAPMYRSPGSRASPARQLAHSLTMLLLCLAGACTLIAQTNPGEPDDPDDPGASTTVRTQCWWGFAIAVPDEGNTMIEINGATVARNGYPEGFGRGSENGASNLRLKFSHPLLGEKSTTVQLKANKRNTIVVHVVEKKVQDKIVRQLEATNLVDSLKAPNKPEILFACMSKKPGVPIAIGREVEAIKKFTVPTQVPSNDPEHPEGIVKNIVVEELGMQVQPWKTIALLGGQRQTVKLEWKEPTHITIGESSGTFYPPENRPGPLVVIYDGLEGEQKMVVTSF